MTQDRRPAALPQARWIDAHCHLADPRLERDLDGRLAEARARGVGAWIQGGIGPDDWDRQRALVKRLGAAVVPAFGLHPWWVASHSRAEVEDGLKRLEAALPEAAALGEVGLDGSAHHCPPESMPLQKWAMERQLEIVRTRRLPLILHVVRSHTDALDRLEANGPFPAGGLVHSFSGSAEVATRYLALGFHLSLGGGVTREGFQKLKKAVACVPHDRLLIETDAPDQTPRLDGVAEGDLNAPVNLIGIAEAVARIQGRRTEDVLDRSAESLRKLFDL